MKGSSCCSLGQNHSPQSLSLPKIVILGSPNVGKSVLFNNLTGRYVTVANYPGTTVEVARGKAKIDRHDFEILDTPGIYSLTPLSEEERVARRILLHESPSLVLHVIDAKNLERMLPLTLQLIEASLPTLLVLNMMDEARQHGIEIDLEKLSEELGIPVVKTVSTTSEGMEELKKIVARSCELRAQQAQKTKVIYDGIPQFSDSIEAALGKMERLFAGDYPVSKRAIGLFLFKEDEEIWKLVGEKEPQLLPEARRMIEETKTHYRDPLEFEVAVELQREASRISRQVLRTGEGQTQKGMKNNVQEFLSRLTINPITGFPILLLVLYWGLYQFVGVFGAGTVVDFLEGTVFEGHANPFFIKVFEALIPWPLLRDLFVGEYGILTQGLRYAVALILPIVTFYFAVFAVIEDTGYLPRLAMLLDRMFKKIGLSGRAVIPMVLGFGCDTMATMVTRTLPTTRERIISTLLLSLAIPCSAQLGVIMALLAGHPLALAIWAGVTGLVFLFIGFLTAQVVPGEKPSFYMELPPLRFPKLTNVITKTYVRIKWYFREVLPLFIAASVLIWAGQLTGLFNFVIHLLAVPVRMIGLPGAAAKVFLFGFFRRDYGAAGLYDLTQQGLLNGVQVLVACVALTLFLPCIAQFLMNVKERGWKTGLWISGFILLFSFGAAFVTNFILVKLGVSI